MYTSKWTKSNLLGNLVTICRSYLLSMKWKATKRSQMWCVFGKSSLINQVFSELDRAMMAQNSLNCVLFVEYTPAVNPSWVVRLRAVSCVDWSAVMNLCTEISECRGGSRNFIWGPKSSAQGARTGAPLALRSWCLERGLPLPKIFFCFLIAKRCILVDCQATNFKVYLQVSTCK